MKDKKANAQAQAVAVGRFIESKALIHSTRVENVFITLALEDLSEQNGLFQSLKEIPQPGSLPSDWRYESIKLNQGDLMIWRGGHPQMSPLGGGGVIQTVTYA